MKIRTGAVTGLLALAALGGAFRWGQEYPTPTAVLGRYDDYTNSAHHAAPQFGEALEGIKSDLDYIRSDLSPNRDLERRTYDIMDRVEVLSEKLRGSDEDYVIPNDLYEHLRPLREHFAQYLTNTGSK